jgi:hypothetical protein
LTVPKVQFFGKVLPEPIKVSVQGPELTWKWQEENLDLVFRVKIDNSIVEIECGIAKYEPGYLVELHKRASDLARASANLAAFAAGQGLIVTLDRFIDPDGTTSHIIFSDPSLPPLCTAFGLEPARQADFDATFRAVLVEPPLFIALNDLIAAITIPHCAPVNCGRVIDSIRHMISPTLDRSAAWQAMQQALNVSRPYQEWISQQSTGPRHADAAFVSGTITSEMTRRTWAIMNRFLEYRKRGNQQLTAPEFPQLN